MSAIIASIILERHPGAHIITNTVTGDDLRDRVERLGGHIVEEYVGHVYIKATMQARPEIVFGGEHSGHYFFRDSGKIDSAVIAFVIFLEYLSRRDIPASVIWEEFHNYEAIPETNFQVRDVVPILDSLERDYARFSPRRGDGVTIRADDWWANIRPASNEPLLRLNIEAKTKQILERQLREFTEYIQSRA